VSLLHMESRLSSGNKEKRGEFFVDCKAKATKEQLEKTIEDLKDKANFFPISNNEFEIGN
jgi:prephenate dehydratase